jgi:hypothetical protein
MGRRKQFVVPDGVAVVLPHPAPYVSSGLAVPFTQMTLKPALVRELWNNCVVADLVTVPAEIYFDQRTRASLSGAKIERGTLSPIVYLPGDTMPDLTLHSGHDAIDERIRRRANNINSKAVVELPAGKMRLSKLVARNLPEPGHRRVFLWEPCTSESDHMDQKNGNVSFTHVQRPRFLIVIEVLWGSPPAVLRSGLSSICVNYLIHTIGGVAWPKLLKANTLLFAGALYGFNRFQFLQEEALKDPPPNLQKLEEFVSGLRDNASESD